MALPKKRKFLKFTLPKSSIISVVYKRKARSFAKGEFVYVRYSFFSKLECYITSNLFFYTLPLVELLKAHGAILCAFYRLSKLSTSFFRTDLCSVFKHKAFVFNNNVSTLLYSTHSLRRELFATTIQDKLAITRFTLGDLRGSLSFSICDVCGEASLDKESSAVVGNVGDVGLLASNSFFFNRNEALDSRLFGEKFSMLKREAGFSSQKSTVDVPPSTPWTKLVGALSPLTSKLNFFKKTNLNALSWVTYILDFFRETRVDPKLRSELTTSVGVFNNFFINTTFYKKIKWKTNFKYYFWTWDPLWMRYRYRIYWAKKAIYQKIDKFVFYYYFRRLRAFQKRRVELISGWHASQSRRYLNIHKQQELGAKQHYDNWLERFFFSKTVWRTNDKLVDLLLDVHLHYFPVRKLTLMSLKLSLTRNRAIFLSIDQSFLAKTYLGFLVKKKSQAKSSGLKQSQTGKFRWSGLFKNVRKGKSPKPQSGSSIKRWKKKICNTSRLNFITVF